MILQICCNLAGSTVFPQLFEALAAAGEEIQVFVPEKRRDSLGKNIPQGVPVVQRLTVRRSDALFFFRKAQRSVPVLRHEVDLSRVRLVHAHTLFTDGSIALALHKATGIPYGVTLRYSDTEVLWRLPWLRPLGRRILASARFVAFTGEAVRARVLAQWVRGAAREALCHKSVVVPNGILPDWLDGAQKDCATPVRVGFAGRLQERKRPMDALRAVQLANARGGRFMLDLCGSGPLEQPLRAALSPQDVYRGALAGMDAMKAFYRGIDLLLVPSSRETFGMVYLEAMSQGTPVIYTRGQGFDGQLPEGEVGLGVDCGDVSAMADALRALSGPDYAQRSARCVQAAKAYAWPAIAGRWQAVYAHALSEEDMAAKNGSKEGANHA